MFQFRRLEMHWKAPGCPTKLWQNFYLGCLPSAFINKNVLKRGYANCWLWLVCALQGHQNFSPTMEAREMVLQLRVRSALAEDLGSQHLQMAHNHL